MNIDELIQALVERGDQIYEMERVNSPELPNFQILSALEKLSPQDAMKATMALVALIMELGRVSNEEEAHQNRHEYTAVWLARFLTVVLADGPTHVGFSLGELMGNCMNHPTLTEGKDNDIVKTISLQGPTDDDMANIGDMIERVAKALGVDSDRVKVMQRTAEMDHQAKKGFLN